MKCCKRRDRLFFTLRSNNQDVSPLLSALYIHISSPMYHHPLTWKHGKRGRGEIEGGGEREKPPFFGWQKGEEMGTLEETGEDRGSERGEAAGRRRNRLPSNGGRVRGRQQGIRRRGEKNRLPTVGRPPPVGGERRPERASPFFFVTRSRLSHQTLYLPFGGRNSTPGGRDSKKLKGGFPDCFC